MLFAEWTHLYSRVFLPRRNPRHRRASTREDVLPRWWCETNERRHLIRIILHSSRRVISCVRHHADDLMCDLMRAKLVTSSIVRTVIALVIYLLGAAYHTDIASPMPMERETMNNRGVALCLHHRMIN